MFSMPALAVASGILFAVSSAQTHPDCPGAWATASDNSLLASGACCVAGTFTFDNAPIACATIIPADSDYSSNLADATSSLAASGTQLGETLEAPFCVETTVTSGNAVNTQSRCSSGGSAGTTGAAGSSGAPGTTGANISIGPGSSGTQDSNGTTINITGAPGTQQVATASASDGASVSSSSSTTSGESVAARTASSDRMLIVVGSIIGAAIGCTAFLL
ncbi:hypothetical protein K491DRAFT_753249 [Lophiostoma macrostomum CBS 122681]|uniref:Extracellular membrane protein CFEM domain-containing protein n=1 Tax=Lophiostoma macrostomum CBS 122681 TaxID=1314788 RepID=A0A6A6TQL4_9PLEO|nr:hypothetical protein K491DRAFT_753249 [Lophiostoma macrostomum CBS 122681]